MKKNNEEWHSSHPMPTHPTRMERVEWHSEHAAICGCRPVPHSLAAEVRAFNRKKASRTN